MEIFSRRSIILLLLLIFTILESYCCTYGMNNGISMDIIAITYFVSGLCIAFLPLIPVKAKVVPSSVGRISILNTILIKTGYLLLAVFFIVNMLHIMHDIPVKLEVADMLPQIEAMCKRLLKGEKIYAPIVEIWGGKCPPYMPLMWLPYTLAQWLQIDIRFTTIVFLLSALMAVVLILPKKLNIHPLVILSAFLLLFFLFNYLLFEDRFILGGSEEGVVVSYYLFLACALVTRKPVLIGIAISCCLMSRFSLFFWVPAYLLFVFFFESKKKALIMCGVIALIITAVFLIPFGFSQPEYFLNIPADYQVGVDRAWGFNRSNNGRYYEKFLGYTRFFDISQIKLLHTLQITVAAILPFSLLGIYALIKNRVKINHLFYGICTLKLTLVFFYNMVEVPYHYLFFTSTFFSYPILFAYIRQYYSPLSFSQET